MKTILVIGAGRSATKLIKYLLSHTDTHGWNVQVADMDLSLAHAKIDGHGRGEALRINIKIEEERVRAISSADVVISMLPPSLHLRVAEDCLKYGKHLLTASYLTPEITALEEEVKSKSLLFLTEMGLDPGIDHMSAMKLIERLKNGGKEIVAFRSFTGGLISPESDDNPWHYKVTWNPRNIVMAGHKTARYRFSDSIKYESHLQQFRNAKPIEIRDLGTFEVYPNRDSVPYANLYGIPDVPTILRGTIRKSGFCEAWSVLISLGLIDDDLSVDGKAVKTYRNLLRSYLPSLSGKLRDMISEIGNCSKRSAEMVLWLFDETALPEGHHSPAQLVQHLILKKWKLREKDRDLIVMLHEVDYVEGGEVKRVTSQMHLSGNDHNDTAMTQLVGLPLGIAAKLILLDELGLTGIHLPVKSEIYDPVLRELEDHGVCFTESNSSI